MRCAFKFFLYTVGIVIGSWVAGFFYFIYMVPTQPLTHVLEKTDAIVVWTGGGCRMATGLELLAKGVSDRLFISGLYRYEDSRETSDKTDQIGVFSELLKKEEKNLEKMNAKVEGDKENVAPIKAEKPVNILTKSCKDCHISLTAQQITALLPKIHVGPQAKTTIGNAIETAQWVKENDIRSMCLVTSPIHIPRSLIECKKYLNHIKVTIYPVELNKFNHLQWYKSWRTVYKVAVEYSKYLSIVAGLRLQRKDHLYEAIPQQLEAVETMANRYEGILRNDKSRLSLRSFV